MRGAPMRRSLLASAVVALVAASARAQSRDEGALPGPLAEGMAVGLAETLAARLARFGDMATEDFLLDREGEGGASSGAQRAVAAANEGREPWTSCAPEGPVRLVDLGTGSMVPLQVALASRGARAVALVTLGRPNRGRQGWSFPASKWVAWEDDAPRVWDAPGFAPDASLVLRENDAAVLAYARTDAGMRRRDDRPIELTQLGWHGELRSPARIIEGSGALDIDAPPVVWQGGTAVVFGESVATAPGMAPLRRESVWFLDGTGRPVRPPLELTAAARDEGRGAAVAGLESHGMDLSAAWTVADGPAAGVWRRDGIDLRTASVTALPSSGEPGAAVRVLSGAGWWGPVLSSWGVTARRDVPATQGDGSLVELVVASPHGAPPSRTLPPVWDPMVAWSPGGALVVASRPGAAPDLAPRLSVGTAAVRTPARWFVDLLTEDEPGAVVDLAISPTERGAVVAWLSADVGHDSARRLGLARIGCRVDAPGVDDHIEGAQAP